MGCWVCEVEGEEGLADLARRDSMDIGNWEDRVLEAGRAAKVARREGTRYVVNLLRCRREKGIWWDGGCSQSLEMTAMVGVGSRGLYTHTDRP